MEASSVQSNIITILGVLGVLGSFFALGALLFTLWEVTHSHSPCPLCGDNDNIFYLKDYSKLVQSKVVEKCDHNYIHEFILV